MTRKQSIISNQKGALTILLLMMLSSLFIVMMGVAGVRLLEASKKASQANEAYNYLLVMEEMGQAVSRARSLGRNNIDCATPIPVAPAGCPTGTVRRTVNTPGVTTYCQVPQAAGAATGVLQYSLCVPDRDGDGTPQASDFCVFIDGFNYCLDSSLGTFNGLTHSFSAVNYAGRPPAYAEVAGTAVQRTAGGTLVPRNNLESWSPDIAWAFNNEIYTTSCSTYLATPENYWLGCHHAADPYIETWNLRMCRPSSTATPNACTAAEMAQQQIWLYFENNVR